MEQLELPDGGTLTYLAREDWDDSGAARLGHIVPAAQFTRLVGHHTVAVSPMAAGFGDEIAFMRKLRTIRPDLGLDVPYSQVVFRQASYRDVVIGEGRGWVRTGAHTAGLNSKVYGVAIAGNTNNTPMTDGMVNAFRWIGSHIVGAAGPTTGHRDHKNTACPGENAYARLHEMQPPFRQETDMDPIVLARIEELEAVIRLSKDPKQLVEAAYLSVLKRKPDKAGFAHWVAFLTAGGSVADMVALFEMSPEARG